MMLSEIRARLCHMEGTMMEDTKPFPDEAINIRDYVKQVVPAPEEWLKTPHELLAGQAPQDLIGTDQEPRLRDLLRALDYGMMA